MIRKHDPGCRCCDTCADATINAGPYTCGATTYTVLFELLDASGATVLQSHTGTTASFTAPAATGYKLRVSGSGIHTKTSSTFTPGCGATISAGPTTWPTSFTQTGNVKIYDITLTTCPLAGTTVAATGDGTGSGVTDSSGNYSFAVSTSSSAYSQGITLTATPASGTGADVVAVGVSVDPCSPTARNFTLPPDSDHVSVICNYKYMPVLMHGEDDYGGADATFDGSGWPANYIYESTHCIKEIDCGGVPTSVADQTGNVRVSIYLSPDTPFTCGSRTFTCYRIPNFTSAPIDCTPTIFTKCQPAADVAEWPAIIAYYNDQTEASCDSAVSIEFEIPALTGPFPEECTVEETAVNVTWTGTI